MCTALFRIATVTFADTPCPASGNRSVQILAQLARGARERWRFRRLNTGPHLRLRAGGFCILLERPLPGPGRAAVAGS